MITNKSLFFIEVNNNKLICRVSLGSINGMMFYFQDKRSDSIVLETTKGIVKIETTQPELNFKILKELKVKLEKISYLQSLEKEIETLYRQNIVQIIN